MGEVYKGRDTRVDRSVAIKILPPSTSNDAEAEGRLEREARALASLSHPRICGLFEFTRLEGLQRGFRTDAAPWPHRTGELTWPRR
jgi:serine/threonine protein kinase